MDEDAPELVADQRTDHASSAGGFGLRLKPLEIGCGHP